MRKSHLALAVLLGLAGCGSGPAGRSAAPDAPLAARGGGSFTRSIHEGLDYQVYLPPSWKRFVPMPLFVMLHGCAQVADDIAAVTRLNDLAARARFAVLYPEQSLSHHTNRCWRWFDPAHQGRDAGEPGVIKGMVDQTVARYGIDARRVHVAGISAGGCMASVLAAVYPDVFAAAGSASGLEYLAATDEPAAWRAMAMGGPDPAPLAGRIVANMGDRPVTMPAIVFHGSADILVNGRNGEQTARQWAIVNDQVLRAQGRDGLPHQPTRADVGQVPGGYAFKRLVYATSAGASFVEHVVVDGLGHAWSGGAPGFKFSDPAGPDATAFMWAFFEPRRR